MDATVFFWAIAAFFGAIAIVSWFLAGLVDLFRKD